MFDKRAGVIRQNLKIGMDANKNHGRPHIHVDYGTNYRMATYAIDTGELLAGSLGSQDHRQVCLWIAERRPKLIMLWQAIQAGEQSDALFLYELRAYDTWTWRWSNDGMMDDQ